MKMLPFIQLALYEMMELVPCIALSALAFRTQVRSRRAFLLAAVSLYVMGFLRRLFLLYLPAASPLISCIWILLYLAAYKAAIRTSTSKILFVLLNVLNYASLIAILYSHIGSVLFEEQLKRYPYCFEASLAILLSCAVTFPLLYRLMRRAAPLLCAAENERVWEFLWLVPSTFCVIFYYALYSYDSVLDFAVSTRNLVFAVVISGGSFFVLSLVLQSVKESNLILHLQAENHCLTLQTLQYENLNSRIEETRRARHDLRQFQAVLAAYLRTGEIESLKRFAADFTALSVPDTPLLYCNCLPLNALISFYADLALSGQIPFGAEINYPEESCISDLDLIVLLGNLLENALEACTRQTEGERFISLVIRPEGGTVVILLDNSFQVGGISREGSGFRSVKHPQAGIGLSSARQITKKHKGVMKIDHTDRVFSVSVMLTAFSQTSYSASPPAPPFGCGSHPAR